MRRNLPRVPSENSKQVDAACPNGTVQMKRQRGDATVAQVMLEVGPKHKSI